MNKLINWLFMTQEDYAFTDIVSGKRVYYYRDSHGNRWLKDGRFSLFKVKIKTEK